MLGGLAASPEALALALTAKIKHEQWPVLWLPLLLPALLAGPATDVLIRSARLVGGGPWTLSGGQLMVRWGRRKCMSGLPNRRSGRLHRSTSPLVAALITAVLLLAAACSSPPTGRRPRDRPPPQSR